MKSDDECWDKIIHTKVTSKIGRMSLINRPEKTYYVFNQGDPYD